MSEAVIAKKAPFAVEVKAGEKYFWCTCGRSARQPFCDGAHKGSDFKPQMFTAEKDGTAYLCGCRATNKAPFCDGTHSKL
jgi:CDGSH-type Zn-finger protein